MSISSLNHLRFSAEPHPAARNTEPGFASTASDNSGAKAAAPRLIVRVPTLSDRIEPVVVSAIVSLQSDNATQEAAPEPVVYDYARKAVAPPSDEADLAAMEAAHQRALERTQERSAKAATSLHVDSAGIVVARQPDFVSVAVSAMREFNDEAERQKRYSPITTSNHATQATAPQNSLFGLKHLASRLNLFA